MYEHNALGYWLDLALCLTKVRSSRARCPATALIILKILYFYNFLKICISHGHVFVMAFCRFYPVNDLFDSILFCTGK